MNDSLHVNNYLPPLAERRVRKGYYGQTLILALKSVQNFPVFAKYAKLEACYILAKSTF